jgi:hypothetical protein
MNSSESVMREQINRLMVEMQLLSLGDVIPLDLFVDPGQLGEELRGFEDQWVPYLPREDRSNNREGLLLFGLPNDKPNSSLSLPEAMARMGKELTELDFNTPTSLFHQCKSLHCLFEYFSPVGRSFLLRVNKGGWFYPHRDSPALFRNSMRVVVFCKNSLPSQFEWWIDGRKMEIEEGRAYYVNTRKVHKTMSFVDHSTHLILNIPVTLDNAGRILRALQHGH